MRQSGLYSCITVPCRIMHKIMGVRLRFCFLSSLRYSSPDGPTATQARSPNGTTPPLPPPPRPRTPGTVHPRHLHIPPVLYVPELLVTPAHHQVTCITHQRHGTTRLPCHIRYGTRQSAQRAPSSALLKSTVVRCRELWTELQRASGEARHGSWYAAMHTSHMPTLHTDIGTTLRRSTTDGRWRRVAEGSELDGSRGTERKKKARAAAKSVVVSESMPGPRTPRFFLAPAVAGCIHPTCIAGEDATQLSEGDYRQ